MKHRNLKAIKIVNALKKFGCEIIRTTDHGVIVENPKNKKSTNRRTLRQLRRLLKQKDIDANLILLFGSRAKKKEHKETT